MTLGVGPAVPSDRGSFDRTHSDWSSVAAGETRALDQQIRRASSSSDAGATRRRVHERVHKCCHECPRACFHESSHQSHQPCARRASRSGHRHAEQPPRLDGLARCDGRTGRGVRASVPRRWNLDAGTQCACTRVKQHPSAHAIPQRSARANVRTPPQPLPRHRHRDLLGGRCDFFRQREPR